MLKATVPTAIFIIGRDTVSLSTLRLNFFAMKNSNRKGNLNFFKVTILALLAIATLSCHSGRDATHSKSGPSSGATNTAAVRPGIFQTDRYLPLLEGKRVAVCGNQTSVNDTAHLVDLLLAKGIRVVKVFAPEHGFRGRHDAGETVENGIDTKTGLPIISLYGRHKKPTPEDLRNVDIIVFDIQDVGARFYTYLSTLHYIMEAAAEQHIPVIVLDRPNPHIDEVDGPVMDSAYFSFVGMHPVPILYGMTIGEYARMINGEGWLKNGVKAKLTVIPILNYTRHTPYTLPVKPSPNLPNRQSVMLYPSLCLLEPTDVSVGRGTDWPFQVFGAPAMCPDEFRFTPKPNEGAKHPKHQGTECCGRDLRRVDPPKGINLNWLIYAYQKHKNKEHFFRKYFERIAGTGSLRLQIQKGLSAERIKASWQPELEKFKKMRRPYLLYPENTNP
ncbi:MAG: DUF1343 domain-containing protein [Chlorobi bacterium]|nr:DUF1343 domain-containing protein [Chlorobiota bacterium]